MRIVDKRSWEARIEVSILKIDKDTLSTYDKLVYVVLAGHANKTGEAWPSVGTIAAAASCSERQVQRSIATLESCGLIIRTEQKNDKGGHTSNTYEIYGFDAYRDPQSGGGCPTVEGGVTDSRGGGDSQSPLIDEQLQKNCSKGTIPLRGSDAPAENNGIENGIEPEEDLVPLEDVPAIMQSTAKLLLFETGRKGITSSELACVKALEKAHAPARIQQELQTVLTRFRNLGRPLESLTFEYLFQALKHQKSRKHNESAKSKPPGSEHKKTSVSAYAEADADMQLIFEKYKIGGEKNADS